MSLSPAIPTSIYDTHSRAYTANAKQTRYSSQGRSKDSIPTLEAEALLIAVNRANQINNIKSVNHAINDANEINNIKSVGTSTNAAYVSSGSIEILEASRQPRWPCDLHGRLGLPDQSIKSINQSVPACPRLVHRHVLNAWLARKRKTLCLCMYNMHSRSERHPHDSNMRCKSVIKVCFQ